jgi:hypothetical protein
MRVASLLVSTRDQLIATWQNVVILVWRKDTTPVGVRTLQEAYDMHAAQFPGGVFLLTIVEEPAGTPPSQASRTALATFLQRAARAMILSAVVHEGTGFRAGVVRSVVTGLALVSKLPYRHRVFATVDEAVAWFREGSDVARRWGARELQDVVAEVRERVARAAIA